MDQTLPKKTADGSHSLFHKDLLEDYHSKDGAFFEAFHLYVVASGYRDLLKESTPPRSVRILDVGLGLGYNACATLGEWFEANSSHHLDLVSLEKDEALVGELQSLKGCWQQSWPARWRAFCQQLQQTPFGFEMSFIHPRSETQARWRIHVGQAEEKIGDLQGPSWDFIWQDPFSPAKNPSLWESSWLHSLSLQSSPHTVLMTYCVAGTVRRNLAGLGWRVERIPTPGAKRQWLRATLSSLPHGDSPSP